jgi:DNA repair exonuclease SbcCD nuclease subunit
MSDGEVTLEALKADKKQLSDAQREIETLRETVERLKDERHYVIHNAGKDNLIRFGVVSDTHFGSLYERADAFIEFYKYLKALGIKKVLHAGDVLDGVHMYKGQEFEQYATGYNQQMTALKKNVPHIPGIETVFITGNHDYSFYKSVGAQPGERIAEITGWKFAGQDQAWIDMVSESGHNLSVMLFHPSGGTAYALSYKAQKLVESLPGGKKPDMIFIGHYHKTEWMPMYRNVSSFQAGCFQGQTPFMATRPTPAHVGGWIIEVALGDRKNLTSSVKAQFIPFYEPEERV